MRNQESVAGNDVIGMMPGAGVQSGGGGIAAQMFQGFFLGRPPFLPFSRAASALASEVALPPLLPSLLKWALMICFGVMSLLCREVWVIFASRVRAITFGVVAGFQSILHSFKGVFPESLWLLIVPDAVNQLMKAIALPVKSVWRVNRNLKVCTLPAALNVCPQFFRELEYFLFSRHNVSFLNQHGHYTKAAWVCQVEVGKIEGKSLIMLSKLARKNIYFHEF